MRPMPVVLHDVDVQHALELRAADDQDPVEALAPHRTDKALGVRIGTRRLDRRLDDLEPLASEDLVERGGELAVTIVDQEARRRGSVGKRPREVARLLRDPECVRIGGSSRQMHPAGCELDEKSTYRRVEKTVSTVKKSHASMLAAWPRMHSRHETPALWPAGPSLASRGSLRIVVVATLNPSARSSPAMRW
jgi:hypothetical protein